MQEHWVGSNVWVHLRNCDPGIGVTRFQDIALRKFDQQLKIKKLEHEQLMLASEKMLLNYEIRLSNVSRLKKHDGWTIGKGDTKFQPKPSSVWRTPSDTVASVKTVPETSNVTGKGGPGTEHRPEDQEKEEEWKDDQHRNLPEVPTRRKLPKRNRTDIRYDIYEESPPRAAPRTKKKGRKKKGSSTNAHNNPLPDEAVEAMKDWLWENSDNPYPSQVQFSFQSCDSCR